MVTVCLVGFSQWDEKDIREWIGAEVTLAPVAFVDLPRPLLSFQQHFWLVHPHKVSAFQQALFAVYEEDEALPHACVYIPRSFSTLPADDWFDAFEAQIVYDSPSDLAILTSMIRSFPDQAKERSGAATIDAKALWGAIQTPTAEEIALWLEDRGQEAATVATRLRSSSLGRETAREMRRTWEAEGWITVAQATAKLRELEVMDKEERLPAHSIWRIAWLRWEAYRNGRRRR